MKNNDEPQELHKLCDTRLLEYATGRPSVTPLENELARRLETYVEVFGDLQGECEPWR